MREDTPFQAVLRKNASEDIARLKGMWAAKIWIVLPTIISLPILLLFGEGDYIIPILALLWAIIFCVGIRIYRSAQIGTVRRSQGFWMSLWSLILAILMAAMAAIFAISGSWRWPS